MRRKISSSVDRQHLPERGVPRGNIDVSFEIA
jgi:hypothetical protein